MLSEHERRVLDAIEAQLSQEEPDLARRLANQRSPFRVGGLPTILIAVGFVAIVIGMALSDVAIAMLCGVVPLAVGLAMRAQ